MIMKKTNLVPFNSLIFTRKLAKNPLVIYLFLALCSNLIIASAIYASTGETIPRNTAYAIGILLLVTLSLSFYLFIVIFQPERF